MLNLKILTTTFNLPLYPRQIPQFRGAVIEKAMRLKNKFVEANIHTDLFHNHCEEETGFHYRYPLIQYQIRHKKACITGVNEGANALAFFLQHNDGKLEMDGKVRSFGMTGFPQIQHHDLRMLDRPVEYRLYKWHALNTENFKIWSELDNFVDKIKLLNKILKNNIFLVTKQMGKSKDDFWDINTNITDFGKSTWLNCHNTPILAFDLVFSANIALPNSIGLGKSVAMGYGKQIPHARKDALTSEDEAAIRALLKK